MKLQFTPTLASDLSASHLLLDSTTLINASKPDDFLLLLSDVRNQGCSFTTIPSVVYEFTRSSATVEDYKDKLEFISKLGIVVLNRIEETIAKEARVFMLAYNKSFDRKQGGPSYTDSLLCATAYKYRTSKLQIITANSRDMPLGLFDRTELITMDIGGELKTEAFYLFSSEKFSTQLAKLTG